MNEIHKRNIAKANQEIEKKEEEIQQSAYRLNYHFMAPTGWINDPNGFVQYKGEYHLFYQFYPYSPSWGPMHWGHAKSKDGVIWEHLSVALAPSEPYDSGDVEGYGCFSGSAVQSGDELVLIYTGHVDGNEPMQVQNLAISIDGIHFEKYEGNPVIDEIPPEGTQDFRDPKVWLHEGEWYMVIGSGKNEKGKALLYQSNNLTEWKYLGVVAESNGSQGDMWECPDLFPMEEKHALIISPMYGTENAKPFCILGDMDYTQGLFNQEFSVTLDYGFDFYAPQTLVDHNNRRVMIGWMEKWLSDMPSQDHGWAGAMTIPRELILNGQTLKQKPLEELKKLRTNYRQYQALEIESNFTIEENHPKSSEILLYIDIQQTTAPRFELQLRRSSDGIEQTRLIVDVEENEIIFDRNRAGIGEKGSSKAPFNLTQDGMLHLRLFMDTTSLEVFINDGEQVITNRIYPRENSNCFNIYAPNGKVNVTSIECWELQSIWNN